MSSKDEPTRTASRSEEQASTCPCNRSARRFHSSDNDLLDLRQYHHGIVCDDCLVLQIILGLTGADDITGTLSASIATKMPLYIEQESKEHKAQQCVHDSEASFSKHRLN